MITIKNIDKIKLHKHNTICFVGAEDTSISYKFTFRELGYSNCFVFEVAKDEKYTGLHYCYLTKDGIDLEYEIDKGYLETPSKLLDFMVDLVSEWENLKK